MFSGRSRRGCKFISSITKRRGGVKRVSCEVRARAKTTKISTFPRCRVRVGCVAASLQVCPLRRGIDRARNNKNIFSKYLPAGFGLAQPALAFERANWHAMPPPGPIGRWHDNQFFSAARPFSVDRSSPAHNATGVASE